MIRESSNPGNFKLYWGENSTLNNLEASSEEASTSKINATIPEIPKTLEFQIHKKKIKPINTTCKDAKTLKKLTLNKDLKTGDLTIEIPLEAFNINQEQVGLLQEKKASFPELIETVLLHYGHYKSVNKNGHWREAMKYTMQKLIPEWTKIFSSEDFIRLKKEAIEYQETKDFDSIEHYLLMLVVNDTLEEIELTKSHVENIQPIYKAIEKGHIKKAFALAKAFETDRRNFAFLAIARLCFRMGMIKEAKKALNNVPDEENGKEILVQEYKSKTLHFQDLFTQVYKRFEKLESNYKTQNRTDCVSSAVQEEIISSVINEFIMEWFKIFSSKDFERLVNESQDFKLFGNPSNKSNSSKLFVATSLRQKLNTYIVKLTHMENIGPVKEALRYGLIDDAIEYAHKIPNKERRYFAFLFITEICISRNLMEEAKEALDNIPDGTKGKAMYLQDYSEMAQLAKESKENVDPSCRKNEEKINSLAKKIIILNELINNYHCILEEKPNDNETFQKFIRYNVEIHTLLRALKSIDPKEYHNLIESLKD